MMELPTLDQGEDGAADGGHTGGKDHAAHEGLPIGIRSRTQQVEPFQDGELSANWSVLGLERRE